MLANHFAAYNAVGLTPGRPPSRGAVRRRPCPPPDRCRRCSCPARLLRAIPAPALRSQQSGLLDMLLAPCTLHAALRMPMSRLLCPECRLTTKQMIAAEGSDMQEQAFPRTFPYVVSQSVHRPEPHAGTKMRPGGRRCCASAAIARRIQGSNFGASSLQGHTGQ